MEYLVHLLTISHQVPYLVLLKRSISPHNLHLSVLPKNLLVFFYKQMNLAEFELQLHLQNRENHDWMRRENSNVVYYFVRSL